MCLPGERTGTMGDPRGVSQTCSLPSSLFYGWLDWFIINSFGNNITFNNLPTPPKSLLVMSANDSSRQMKTQSIWTMLIRQYGGCYLRACGLILINCSLDYVPPQFLKLIVNYVDSDEETWKGVLYAATMCVSQLMSALCLAHAQLKLNHISIQMRSNISSLIYTKALRLSNRSRHTYDVGEITNYIAVDAERIMTTVPHSFNIWSAPFQVTYAVPWAASKLPQGG